MGPAYAPTLTFAAVFLGANLCFSLFCAHRWSAVDEVDPDWGVLFRAIGWGVGFQILHMAVLVSPLGPALAADGSNEWAIKFGNRVCALVHALASVALCSLTLWNVLRMPDGERQTRSLLSVAYAAPRSSAMLFAPVELTLGFALYDLGFLVAHEPNMLFLLHHIAIVAGFVPLAFVRRGYVMVVLGTWVAELSNPLHLVWTWARDNSKRSDITPAQKQAFRDTYQSLSTALTFLYVVLRGVAMPISLLDIAHFLFIRGEATLTLVWIWVICCAGFAGSVLWIKMLVSGWLKFQRSKANVRAIPTATAAGSTTRASAELTATDGGEAEIRQIRRRRARGS